MLAEVLVWRSFSSKFQDTSHYSLVSNCIVANEPGIIVIPDHQCVKLKSILEDLCHDLFAKKFSIEAAARQLFRAEEVHVLVDRYFLEPASIKNYLMDKSYCRSAISGLFKYLQLHFLNFLIDPITFAVWQHQKRLFIDAKTSYKYSLDTSSDPMNKTNTLFHRLNHTKTNLGAMLLRQHILQPLIDKEEILQRLNGVEELVSNQEQYYRLGNSLAKLSKFGVEVLRRCTSLTNFKRLSDIEFSIQSLIDLTSALGELKNILSILSSLGSPIFGAVKKVFQRFFLL